MAGPPESPAEHAASPAVEAEAPVTVVVWATDESFAAALARAAEGQDREIVVVAEDADLLRLLRQDPRLLLVAEEAPLLAEQANFIQAPFVLVRRPGTTPAHHLARRAYAVVNRPAEVGLALDRMIEHRRLARRAALRREPPRQCTRCGRGFDPRRGLSAPSRRFVRFGTVSLCGSCVEALRRLIVGAQAPYVDGEVQR